MSDNVFNIEDARNKKAQTDQVSDGLPEFKCQVSGIALEKGHKIDRWYRIGEAHAHEALCGLCGGRLHVWWDYDEQNWVADGDLVVCGCVARDEYSPRQWANFAKPSAAI
jgi:hypothetical protein